MNRLILSSIVLNVILALPCVAWMAAKGITVGRTAAFIEEKVPRLKEYFELGMECVCASFSDIVFVDADSSSKFDIVHYRKACGIESFLISWKGNESCRSGNKIFIAPDIMVAFLRQKDGSQSLYLRYNNNEPLLVRGNVLCIGKRQLQDYMSKGDK